MFSNSRYSEKNKAFEFDNHLLRRTTISIFWAYNLYFRKHIWAWSGIFICLRDINADLKISLDACAHVKIITRKFRILNPIYQRRQTELVSGGPNTRMNIFTLSIGRWKILNILKKHLIFFIPARKYSFTPSEAL